MSGFKKILFGAAMFGVGALVGHVLTKKMFIEQYKADVADIQAFYRQKLEEVGVMEEGYEPPEGENGEDTVDVDLLSWQHKGAPIGRAVVEGFKNGIKVTCDPNGAAETTSADAINSYRGERKPIFTDYTKPPLESMGRALGVTVPVEPNGEENLGDIDDEEGDDAIDPEYEAEIEAMAEDYARRRSENMKSGRPYLIEPEEFHDGPAEYDRQALYYYSGDRTLCEDDDRVVEDEEACVGYDYEDKLDMQTTAWVRNDKTQVLYEIHRLDESYRKAVLGAVETPREREFRLQGRRKQALDNM